MFEEKVYTISSLNDLPDAARWLLKEIGSSRLIAATGAMGAGKTTLIQSICYELGVTQNVTSPTFALVNEYISGKDEPIYHFDFYRIDDPIEALDFGLEEYLHSGFLCLMEWPEKINDFLPDETLTLSIEEQPDQSRILRLRLPE